MHGSVIRKSSEIPPCQAKTTRTDRESCKKYEARTLTSIDWSA